MSTITLEGPHTAAEQRAEHTGRIHTPPETNIEQPDDGGSSTGIPPRFPPVDHDHRGGHGGEGGGVPRLSKIFILAGFVFVAFGLLVAFLEGKRD
jgi:hypothetical protein